MIDWRASARGLGWAHVSKGPTRPPTTVVVVADANTVLWSGTGAELVTPSLYSILKFFQVDITVMFRMTSSARYFKDGVDSSRPNWR